MNAKRSDPPTKGEAGLLDNKPAQTLAGSDWEPITQSRPRETLVMSTDMDTSEIRAFVPGEHLHLNEMLEDPPPPGSIAWLPIIRSLALEIAPWGEGCWAVSIQLGTIKKPPSGPLPTESIPALVDQAERFTPPDVWRLDEGPSSNDWEGDKTTWHNNLTARVRECVTYSRSAEDSEAGEDFISCITYLVGEST